MNEMGFGRPRSSCPDDGKYLGANSFTFYRGNPDPAIQRAVRQALECAGFSKKAIEELPDPLTVWPERRDDDGKRDAARALIEAYADALFGHAPVKAPLATRLKSWLKALAAADRAATPGLPEISDEAEPTDPWGPCPGRRPADTVEGPGEAETTEPADVEIPKSGRGRGLRAVGAQIVDLRRTRKGGVDGRATTAGG
jgi:hypothetical protein